MSDTYYKFSNVYQIPKVADVNYGFNNIAINDKGNNIYLFPALQDKGPIYISNTSGKSWYKSDIESAHGLNPVVINSTGTIVYASDDTGKIRMNYKSGKGSWSKASNTEYGSINYMTTNASGKSVYIINQKNKIYTNNNYGKSTWNFSYKSSEGLMNITTNGKGNIIYATTNVGNIYKNYKSGYKGSWEKSNISNISLSSIETSESGKNVYISNGDSTNNNQYLYYNNNYGKGTWNKAKSKSGPIKGIFSNVTTTKDGKNVYSIVKDNSAKCKIIENTNYGKGNWMMYKINLNNHENVIHFHINISGNGKHLYGSHLSGNNFSQVVNNFSFYKLNKSITYHNNITSLIISNDNIEIGYKKTIPYPMNNLSIRNAVSDWTYDPIDTIYLYGNINDWDTSDVTDMSTLFSGNKKFNDYIGSWNTSKVTDMNEMFENAQLFNQPLNNWNTSKVTNMNEMFFTARLFNQNIGKWNTSSVTNMNNMFEGVHLFNQSLKSWNTSKVTYMDSMFIGAQSFNQDIKSWDVSKVIKNENYGGFAYNSPLCKSNKAYIPDGLKASIACSSDS